MSLGFMILLFFILFNSDQAMVWVVLTVLYIYTVGTEKYFPISPIPCPSLSLLTSFTFRFSSCTFPSNHWFWAHIQHSLCFYSCTQAIPSPFHSCQPFCYTQYLPDLFFVFFFFFFRATPAAYGSSQARGPMRVAATSQCHSHSHSNTRSKPHLQATLQPAATPDP